MKQVFFYWLISLTFLVLFSCNSNVVENSNNNTPENPNGGGETEVWSIPLGEVRDGGPGKDGIPAIDNPMFINAASATFLNDEDLVIGILNNGEAKVYPHLILDWHEVLNDKVGGEPITISYCPLTGTAFGWKGTSSTFGVSGLLYNANLILYDRATDSNWSQLALECVNGDKIGSVPQTVGLIETNWRTMKKLYPNTKVLSLNTGFTKDYGVYPYGDYITNDSRLIFPVNPLNSSLNLKERVYAIISNGSSKIFRYGDFISGLATKDTFNGKNFLIVGNGEVFNSFELNGSQSSLIFQFISGGKGESEAFFKDNEGSEWNVFGEAINGPRKGQKMIAAQSVVSYWFAIAAFYPDPTVF